MVLVQELVEIAPRPEVAEVPPAARRSPREWRAEIETSHAVTARARTPRAPSPWKRAEN